MVARWTIQAAISIAFGALAGGITNAVAVWMLFHPYTPRGLWRFRIQGAIPKNRTRLAKAVGRTVGERLLTADDLARQLNAPGVRQAFEEAVKGLATNLLETERGALRQELPPPLIGEIEATLDGLGPALAGRLAAHARTQQFRSTLERGLARVAEDLADRPVGELLTAARQEAVSRRVEQWVVEAVASPDLERTVGGWLDRQMARAGADQTPLLDRLPPGLVATVEHGISQYLPVALERLAGVLADPGARARVQRALHQLFERFAQDLLIHQRIVARLVVTEKSIGRLLETFDREGVDHLARLLEEPEMRSRVARGVNDAVVTFLRRPLADHVTTLGPERLAGLRDALASGIVAALRDPATRAYGIERLDQALAAAERRHWGDLLRQLPPDRVAEWLAGAVASPEGQEWIGEALRGATRGLLDRPIGRPAVWLPEGGAERLTGLLAPLLWDWVQRQVPEVIARLNIAAVVEEKVMAFSLARLEQLIRSVTQRELDIIVRLGYLLGAVVGAAAFGAALLAQ